MGPHAKIKVQKKITKYKYAVRSHCRPAVGVASSLPSWSRPPFRRREADPPRSARRRCSSRHRHQIRAGRVRRAASGSVGSGLARRIHAVRRAAEMRARSLEPPPPATPLHRSYHPRRRRALSSHAACAPRALPAHG